MNKYIGHTHKWVKPDGSFKYVQMYLQTDQGYEFNNDEQAYKIAILDPSDAGNFRYDIFDITKRWRLEDLPARPFGKLTLNRSPDNYFAEIEQLALSPSHLVPGIEPSADPVLQARMFAYPDAQRHRLGVNYQRIPVNCPKHAFNPLQRDGKAAGHGNGGTLPSRLSSSCPISYKRRLLLAPHEEWKGRITAESRWGSSDTVFESPHSPRGFWTMIGEEKKYGDWQEKMVGNISRHLSGACADVRRRAYALFRRVHEDLGHGVETETETEALAAVRDTYIRGEK
ncbi:MAG: hypothetical protein Q9181_002483 [Wetmoreana brouardii]